MIGLTPQNNKPIRSILIITLPELPEINRRMTQSAMLQLILLDLTVIHLVLAAFAAVVCAGYYRFSADHTSWEVAPT